MRGSATRAPNSISPASSAGGRRRLPIPSALGGPPEQAATSPNGSAAAASSRSCVSRGSVSSRSTEALLDPARQRRARPAARTRRPAPPASARAAARAAPAGYRGSRRRSGRARAHRAGPGIDRVQQGRASASARPSTTQLRQPGELLGRRSARARAKTIAIRSASSRRATNASTCADARSSHCASSTRHTSGCYSAASASRLEHRERRRGSGLARSPSLQYRTRSRSASRCGAGSALEPVEQRRAELVEPGERQLHLRLDADGPHDPAAADACSATCSSRAVLPTPASPRSTSTALWPVRAMRQPVERGALVAATAQHRPNIHTRTGRLGRQPGTSVAASSTTRARCAAAAARAASGSRRAIASAIAPCSRRVLSCVAR